MVGVAVGVVAGIVVGDGVGSLQKNTVRMRGSYQNSPCSIGIPS